jgi:hypothetical protein
MWHINTENKILSLAKAWMELEIIMLSNISQIQKDEYSMILHICVVKKSSLVGNRMVVTRG